MEIKALIKALRQVSVETGSIACLGCGHEVMLPRSKAEKNIRSIEREGETIC